MEGGVLFVWFVTMSVYKCVQIQISKTFIKKLLKGCLSTVFPVFSYQLLFYLFIFLKFGNVICMSNKLLYVCPKTCKHNIAALCCLYQH